MTLGAALILATGPLRAVPTIAITTPAPTAATAAALPITIATPPPASGTALGPGSVPEVPGAPTARPPAAAVLLPIRTTLATRPLLPPRAPPLLPAAAPLAGRCGDVAATLSRARGLPDRPRRGLRGALGSGADT